MLSKVNPQIKYYSLNKPSHKKTTYEIIDKIMKNSTYQMKKHPNLIEDHRKFIMNDYIRKV